MTSNNLHPILATSSEATTALLKDKPKLEAKYNPDFSGIELSIISFLEKWYPTEFKKVLDTIPNAYFQYNMEVFDIKIRLIHLVKDLHETAIFDKAKADDLSEKYWSDIYSKIFGLSEIGIRFKNFKGK